MPEVELALADPTGPPCGTDADPVGMVDDVLALDPPQPATASAAATSTATPAAIKRGLRISRSYLASDTPARVGWLDRSSLFVVTRNTANAPMRFNGGRLSG
jgi:hypothetical protein